MIYHCEKALLLRTTFVMLQKSTVALDQGVVFTMTTKATTVLSLYTRQRCRIKG